MNAISGWLIALALLSWAAYGQVPASNDTSDMNGNTGMGQSALGGPAASNKGSYNTASGRTRCLLTRPETQTGQISLDARAVIP